MSAKPVDVGSVVPGKSVSLKVAAKLPGDDLALTNKVYISNDDYKKLKVEGASGDFVMIKDYVFSYAAHAGIAINSIGFNAIQRKLLLLGLNDLVDVQTFSPNLEQIYLSNVTIEVNYHNTKLKGDEFKAEDLASLVQRDISGQILSVGQIFALDFRSTILLFTVKKCEVVDLAQIMKGSASEEEQTNSVHNEAQRGILHKSSAILFEKGSASALRIVGGQQKANDIFRPNWNFEDLEIGGLDKEFSDIFRRAFASRIYPADSIRKYKIQHVKGILLFGPPGTGKTLMARQISKMLNAKELQIVLGPEILNPYVGKSEENVRNLFKAAEADQAQNGDESGLHIIVFDEIDAICKQRGSRNDGTGVGDTVVNQLLTKMDGPESLNNILVIGMTNRKDMIDEALLRAGRFEVHMEISLPDEKGRLQILKIHTKPYRENNSIADDVDLAQIAAQTKNFSGADIAGLIRNATSCAMNRNLDVGKGVKLKSTNILINNDDFMRGIQESKPLFGTDDKDFEGTRRNGIIKYGETINKFLSNGVLFVNQVKNSARTPLVSVLFEGSVGSGKTALAAKIATESGYPYVKLISPEMLVGYSETGKCAKITKVFDDSYRSPISCIVIDDLERLVDYVRIGPRFSNTILQTLLVLLKKEPPHQRRLLIIATSSNKRILEDLELIDAFNASMHVPQISNQDEFRAVLADLKAFNESELEAAVRVFPGPISIKRLIMMVEMSRQNTSGSTLDRFVTAMKNLE